jgi:hypothetical protein
MRRLMALGLGAEVTGYDPNDNVRSAEVLEHEPWRLSFVIVVEMSLSIA